MTRGADRAAGAGEQHAADADAPASAPSGARWRRPWRRDDEDEDDGPFFPADRAAPAGDTTSANGASSSGDAAAAATSSGRPRPGPRPRPRPAVAEEAPARTDAPVADDATEPAPDEPSSAADQPSGAADEEHRDPAIDRFIAATEPHPGDDDPEPKEPMRRRRRIRGSRGLRTATRLLIIVGVVAVITLVLRAYVVSPYYIPSASMEPTLRGGGGGTDDRILVDKVSYRVHDPHQGDIVVFDRPDTWKVPDKTLVKRVVGLPGDIVSLRRGIVYVNGTRLTENYLNDKCGSAPSTPHTRTSQWRVPMDDYFVMGDNRCDSEDSRDFGPVPQSKIVGRAFVIVWPLSRFGSP